MPARPLVAVLLLLLTLVRPSLASPLVKNSVTEVTLSPAAITIADGRGAFKTYQVRPTTAITLNNQKAKLEDVTPGMIAAITAGDIGVAERIVLSGTAAAITRPAASPGQPAGQTRLRIDPNVTPTSPLIIGKVTAGQTVTLTALKSRWCGGGNHAGIYCGWTGYQDAMVGTKPLMALIATIGQDTFYPQGPANVLTFVVPRDGTLTLSPNHLKPTPNSGFTDLAITIETKK